MRGVVVYESMYGNTHLIAEAIGAGLADSAYDVVVVPVGQAGHDLVYGADLIVVGGPTHAHSLSRASTRRAAVGDARKPGHELVVEPDAEGPGLREWFESLGQLGGPAAAFDTRVNVPAWVAGRASRGISKRLRVHGCTVVTEPRSFLVTKHNDLEPGEQAEARRWGQALAAKVWPAASPGPSSIAS